MNAKHEKFFETVIDRCDERIQNCERAQNAFVAKLRENYHTAMTWSDSQFELAAEWKVAHVLKSLVNDCIAKGKEPKELRRDVQDIVLQDAKYVKHSTSIGTNQMEVETTAAYSRTLDSFDGLLGRVDA